VHSIALDVLGFPMMCLWFSLGEWLKLRLTDDRVLSLFTIINAILWGWTCTWLIQYLIWMVDQKVDCQGANKSVAVA
jgi:hypothetical protein